MAMKKGGVRRRNRGPQNQQTTLDTQNLAAAIVRATRQAQNSTKFEETKEKIATAQARNMGFAAAYHYDTVNNPIGTKPYRVTEFMAMLSRKTLKVLLLAAVNRGLLTAAQATTASAGLDAGITDANAWKILKAGVLDDLPPEVLGEEPEPGIADAFMAACKRKSLALAEHGDCLEVLDNGKLRQIPLGASHVRRSVIQNGMYDEVNLDAIRAFFHPRLYQARINRIDNLESALLYASASFSLTTNVAGNAQLLFLPYLCFTDSNSGTVSSFITTRNAANYSPDLGTGTIFSENGIFRQYANIISSYRHNSWAISFEPNPSVLNQGGLVQAFSYSLTPTNDWTDLEVPLGEYAYWPTYQKQALKDVHKMRFSKGALRLADQEFVTDIDISLPYFTQEGVVLNISGAPASTTVLTATVTSLLEYVPNSEYRPVAETAFPAHGPATTAAITKIISRRPNIICCTEKEVEDMFSSWSGDRSCSYSAL